MSRLQPIATGGRKRAGTFGEFVLQWSQHQGQRCAKFVADVGEECRLRSINLRQCFGALSLFLISSGVGNLGGYSRCQQVEESAIGFIQRQSRADTGHQDPNRPFATGRRDRKRQGLLHGFGIFAT